MFPLKISILKKVTHGAQPKENNIPNLIFKKEINTSQMFFEYMITNGEAYQNIRGDN